MEGDILNGCPFLHAPVKETWEQQCETVTENESLVLEFLWTNRYNEKQM